MSQSEFHDWLFKAATGWLGWSPAVALATPMPQIEAAFEGRMEMLKAIFGSGGKGKNEAPLGTKLKAAMSLRGTNKVVRKKKP